MGRITLRIALVALIMGLGMSPSLAQETPAQQKPTTQKPKDTRVSPPAAPIAPLATGKEAGQPAAGKDAMQENSSTSNQRERSLTGVEQYTLHTMGQGHNYFYPLFQVAQSGDTNANNQFGSTNFESVSTISGAFVLNHVWSRYTFAANYAGSGFIYNQDPSISSSAHTFSLSQRITGARSSFLVADAVSYLPESSYGYARFGGIGNFDTGGLSGINNAGLNGIYVPSQSILSGDSSRISNAAAAQYEYNLSPLSSLTFTGSYGLLRFPNSGFIDSNAGIFGMGYNHSFTRRDTIAINYVGTIFRYDQPVNNFNNHTVSLMYGHQISHLLRLHLGGGPQVNTFPSATNNAGTMVSWYATASLAYQLPRTIFTLWYNHYTTAGAGVFVGAKTDDASLSINRRLTRMWTGDLNLGYSHNANLQENTTTSPTFNTWYVSANLQRPLGRYMGLFLSYNLQQQSSSDPLCIGTGCGTFYTRNYFSIGFNWHPRTVELGERY